MFPTQKAFPLRALECMHLLQQCQHGKSTSTTTNWHPRVPINEKAKPSRGATTIPHKLHVHRKNGKGFCLQVPPTTSIANITAHVLPSRDGKKLDVDHPTMIRTSREPTNPTNGTRPNLQVDSVGKSFLSHHPSHTKCQFQQNRRACGTTHVLPRIFF
jgi:hypothetical protein